PSALGQPWPAPFESVVDGVVTLAHVAGATSRIRLGSATLVAPYVAPVVLAKQLAALDVVSGGRLVAGLSIGWSADEYEACGVPFTERGARFDESLACLEALWGDEPVGGDDRRPLWGSLDQVRADIDGYRSAGLDELFLELNFDPAVAAPGADPKGAMAKALLLLDELAP